MSDNQSLFFYHVTLSPAERAQINRWVITPDKAVFLTKNITLGELSNRFLFYFNYFHLLFLRKRQVKVVTCRSIVFTAAFSLSFNFLIQRG